MSETSQPQPTPGNLLATQVGTLKSQGNSLLTIVLTIVLTVLVLDRFRGPSAPSPAAPLAPVDPHFVEVGKGIEPKVAPAYAEAWAAFAQAIDAGQPLSAAFKVFETRWEAGRQSLTAGIQAELGHILPPGTKDDAVSPSQRAAVAAAARGIAQGLNKGTALPWHFLPLRFEVAPRRDAGPIVAGDFSATEARAKFVSRPASPPESRPTPGTSKPTERATPPAPPTGPEPAAWHWRILLADPRLEAWGRIDGDGVFRYTETRWRSAPIDWTPQPQAAPAANCYGGT